MGIYIMNYNAIYIVRMRHQKGCFIFTIIFKKRGICKIMVILSLDILQICNILQKYLIYKTNYFKNILDWGLMQLDFRQK